MKIGIITCLKIDSYYPTLAEPDFLPTESPIAPDDQLMVDQLRLDGHTVTPVIWGMPVSTLIAYDLLILRSPWDYMDSPKNKDMFMQWLALIEAQNIKIANPISFVQWMLDKHYLQALAAQGVAMIPTTYYERGSALNLTHIFEDKGEYVLKPCVSAGGVGLLHIQSKQDALRYQTEFNLQIEQDSYMLQPFIPEIRTKGEWSLVFINGQYSHSVHKIPGKDSILVQPDNGGSILFNDIPSDTLIQFAKNVYAKILPTFNNTAKFPLTAPLLYLRIDVIESSQGYMLVECEGAEPELFFRAHQPAIKAFCQSITGTKTRSLMNDIFPQNGAPQTLNNQALDGMLKQQLHY